MVVGLSYGTRGVKAAQEWARNALLANPDYTGILLFHQFVTRDGIVLPDDPFVTDIIAQCPNVRLVLCGHSRCIARTQLRFKDTAGSDAERVVNVLCFDYQLEDPLSNSYLQFLTFDPSDRSVFVTSYSPIKDDYVLNDENPEKECFLLQNAF